MGRFMKQLRKQQEDDVLLKRINTLEVENDKLRAENEKLRNALEWACGIEVLQDYEIGYKWSIIDELRRRVGMPVADKTIKGTTETMSAPKEGGRG